MLDKAYTELNLRILDMCEKVLPNTRMANNRSLSNLLQDIRTALEETPKNGDH